VDGRGKKMKLNKLRLQSYRNHTDSTLDLSGASLIVIRGVNASGKSSIGQAISVNLTNTTMGLDTQGKGFTAKIKTGESKSVITAEVQGKHLLRNTVTLNTNTSGRTSNVECLDEPDDNKIINAFKNFLSDRKTALLIAANTDHFSRQEEKEQTNLLAKLVLPPRYDFPQDKREAVNDALGEGVINFDGEPFDVITKSYKALYKERETVNRQVRDFVIPDSLPLVKGVDSASLKSQQEAIREQRAKLQIERDTAMQKATEVEIKRGRLQTKIEGLRAELDRGKKRLNVLESSILEYDGQVKELTEVAGKAEELAELNKQHSAYHGGMQVVSEQISRLKGISEKGESGATCPTCDQDIDTIKIGAMILDLEKEYADADKKLQELDTKIEAIGDVQGAKESLRKHNEAVKESDELEASLAEVVKAGKATKADLEALGEAVNATAPFVQPLADLQAKEDKINEQLRPVIAAEERAKERERLTEQLKKLQAKAAKLDSLVKWFDKDGIKADLIAQYIGGFESKINSVLEAFGYKTSLSMEPFSFEVTTARGYVGPVKELSGAEEHIFKAAFQCAVSIAAGINLVVIDEIEELGSDIRPFLFQKIFQLIQEGTLEQAILIGYSTDKTLPKPQAPGSRYFYVEDGIVEELK
jgi:DNA repair exonuclease SbcCD ATPase subunit